MDAKPDIVVSVDLGTTFTGVAWMTPRMPIQVISDWPGSGERHDRKVPTTLIYNMDGSVSSWGFLCEEEEEQGDLHGKRRFEFFKIFMDQDTLADAQQQGLTSAPRNTVQAQRLVADYLRQIYTHVKDSIETNIGRKYSGGWSNMAVEFLFSVPTTWTSQEIINCFKAAISNAGFGVEGPRHSAQVDLTEAEAAAVATLKNSPVSFTLGSLFLAVDAGGGTTDVALMRVASANLEIPQMSSIHPVSGVGIGSTLIDRLFVLLVAQRVAPYPEITARLFPGFAERLARSHAFRSYKHKFGTTVWMQGGFQIQVDEVPRDYSHPGAGITKGKMVFSQSEMQSLFDPHVDRIFDLITEQLDWLTAKGDRQQQYLILSGGLGSSVYVRQRLEQQFMSMPHPNASSVAVVPYTDPQLAVSRGLLVNRQQRWETGEDFPVLATRIARASYGVVVQELYVPAKHFNEDIRTDRFDGSRKWAINQVQWLVKKGEVVNPSVPLFKSFQIRLAEGEVTRSWDSQIVISHNEPGFLPRSLKHAGVTKLCEVKSNLMGVQQQQLEKKSKRGSCCGRGYTFYLCKFDIRVVVEPADLRFELWFDGQKFSGNHEPITVAWDREGTILRG